MRAGGFAYIPPGAAGACAIAARVPAHFHWIRKLYQSVPTDLPLPDPVVTNETSIAPAPMPDTEGRWATTRFVDPADLRHDMHITIVTLEPGASIPFAETHVMEHGLYVLEGKAVYRLNQDWVEVEAGDYMWLRAFCPQACYAGGPGRFRYLLYKDVNRHMDLRALRPAKSCQSMIQESVKRFSERHAQTKTFITPRGRRAARGCAARSGGRRRGRARPAAAARQCARDGFQRQPEIVADVAAAHRQRDHAGFGEATVHFEQEGGDALHRGLAAEQQHVVFGVHQFA